MGLTEPPPLGEFGRIARFLAPLAAGLPGAFGLTDDAASIDPPPGASLVVSADALVESVHFLPADPPDLVAQKLLRVNLSDLAAKGAAPLAYFLTMALPARCDDRWVEQFARGLGLDQERFGIALGGGDSVSISGPIALSITAIGTAARGGMVRRAGALAGDLIFVSGTIGDGALGLLVARHGLLGLEPADRRFLEDRYRLPQPRLALGRALAGHVHAMLDVSDGLLDDLGHLARASGVGAVVETSRLPLSDAAGSALADDLGLIDTILGGGDDYELLFAAAPDAEPAIRAAADAAGVPVTMIGRCVKGSAVTALDRDGRPVEPALRGWRHA